VRAYLMLLFVENSDLAADKKEDVRVAICKQLGQTWQGRRVDRAFVMSLIANCSDALKSQIELADRLAPLMTTSEKIAGNPRLIKRFLNTLIIRQSIARGQSVTVDEAALAKLLLFERCAPADTYAQLVTSINSSDEGKPTLLKLWEDLAAQGKEIDLPGSWNRPFVRQWLVLSPPLADQDMRGITYVSREHLPIITAADELSAEAADLFQALLAVKTQQSDELTRRLKGLGKREVVQVLDRLLVRARREQTWGTPPILFAALTVAAADTDHAETLARFLRQIPPAQLTPSIVPLLADRPWAGAVLQQWGRQADASAPVKKAIANTGKKTG
jgi:predicted KAP-like P-loop ATPase